MHTYTVKVAHYEDNQFKASFWHYCRALDSIVPSMQLGVLAWGINVSFRATYTNCIGDLTTL